MKYTWFLALITVAGLLLFEWLCRKAFHTSSLQILTWHVSEAPDWAIGIFTAGLCGLVFATLLAYRCDNVFVAATGKKESYVFLGDHMTKGFYAYREDDKAKARLFIPSFLDATVYPASSFHAIYMRKAVLRDAQGNFTSMDFLRLPNQVLWSFIHLATFMFSICGVLAILKSYGLHAKDWAMYHEAISQTGIGGTFTVLNAKTNGFFTYFISAVLLFYAISILMIKVLIGPTDTKAHRVQDLPLQITSGVRLRGKIIDSEYYSTDSNRPGNHSQLMVKFYKRYLIEFSDEFDTPVVLNFSLLRKQSEKIILQLDAAAETKVPVTITLDEDLCVDKDFIMPQD